LRRKQKNKNKNDNHHPRGAQLLSFVRWFL